MVFYRQLGVVFVLLAWAAFKCQAQIPDAFISMNPTELQLAHNATSQGAMATVRCTGTPGDTGQSLFSLTISRLLDTVPANATPTSIITIQHHHLSPQVIYPIDGAAAFGSVAMNFLTLRMSAARCQDAGLYICSAAYLVNDVVTYTVNTTLPVTVDPGHMVVVSEPPFRNWAANNTVNLTCSGPIGSALPDSQVTWHWEFWDTESDTWRAYDGAESDVSTGETNEMPCYETGSSVLTRQLQEIDSKRSYRCYVERDGLKFKHFAGQFQFGSVVSITALEEAQEDYELCLLEGTGYGVAAAAGLAIIVTLVVCCCFRTRCCVCCGDTKEEEGSVKSPPKSKAKQLPPPKPSSQQNPDRRAKLQTNVRNGRRVAPRSGSDVGGAPEGEEEEGGETYDAIDNRPPVAPLATAGKRNPKAASSTSGVASNNDDNDSDWDWDTVLDLAVAQQQQVAAEDVLHTLLSTRHVLSWRVRGEPRGCTSFILRLSPSSLATQHKGRWKKLKHATGKGGHHIALPQESARPLALPEVPSNNGEYTYESPRGSI